MKKLKGIFMKVLITGSDGFIAKNLIEYLSRIDNIELFLFQKEKIIKDLEKYIEEVDFIFHLAGVNRPKNSNEYYKGNIELTELIINLIEKNNKKIPILFSSSIQVGNGSDYAKSKEKAEKIIKEYSKKNQVNCFIYRLPNVFGKWARPNYNSVIVTWCYNIARDLEIYVDDKNKKLKLVYIDDVVYYFSEKLFRSNNNYLYCEVNPIYEKTLGEILDLLYEFKKSRKSLLIPRVGQSFERILYATYLSYLPKDKFSYKLKGHEDDRGTFYEILKTIDSGQISVSITKPGITRGNHYHNTKNEKFLVIRGKALIELRNIFSKEVIKYEVSDEELKIVEMIPGYTHNITNIGDDEMILLIWANENFDSNNSDTYYLKV